MMVPSQRLLWCAAAIALPAATLAGLSPSLFAAGAIVLVAFGVVCALDAAGGSRRIAALRVSTPAMLRFTKDVAAALPVTIENGATMPLIVRVAATLPQGVAGEPMERPQLLAPGASLVE